MGKVAANCFICPEEIQEDDYCVPIKKRDGKILALAHSECFDALKEMISEDCMFDPDDGGDNMPLRSSVPLRNLRF